MTATLFQRVFRPSSFRSTLFSSPCRSFSNSTRPVFNSNFFATNPRSNPSSLYPLRHRLKFFSTSSPSQLRYHLSRSGRRSTQNDVGFLDRIPQNTIFYGIIGLNGLVFVMWYMSTAKYKHEGDPSAYIWMQKNFTASWQNLTSGRIWTTLTCCFSHQNLPHILMNGFTFYFMAQPVQQILGNKQFLLLYLGGGLVSSFASIAYAKVKGKANYSSLGASGAIYSTVTLLACAAPTLTFRIYGIVPVPAWLAVSGLFAWDLYSTVSENAGMVDTVGHIGGMFAGVGFFLAKRFRIL